VSCLASGANLWAAEHVAVRRLLPVLALPEAYVRSLRLNGLEAGEFDGGTSDNNLLLFCVVMSADCACECAMNDMMNSVFWMVHGDGDGGTGTGVHVYGSRCVLCAVWCQRVSDEQTSMPNERAVNSGVWGVPRRRGPRLAGARGSSRGSQGGRTFWLSQQARLRAPPTLFTLLF
jgi:hypothetical protein